MKSHEYAEKLKAAAEFLLAREDGDFTESENVSIPMFFWTKEAFVSAVRAVGPGKKEWKSDELHFTPKGPCEIFTFFVRRANVCRLVRPAEYDCEPILSEAEVAAL